jgi:hypothetical protein
MCPFFTDFSQIYNGLLPMLYKIDKNPDWKVFLNINLTNYLSDIMKN